MAVDDGGDFLVDGAGGPFVEHPGFAEVVVLLLEARGSGAASMVRNEEDVE